MSQVITIIRDEDAGDDGLLGTLLVGSQRICSTLELPYRDNQPSISCLPAGPYQWRIASGKKWRIDWVIEILEDITTRVGFFIHPGNTVLDTHGCILVGLVRGTIRAKDQQLHRAVTGSRLALLEVLKSLQGETSGPLNILDHTIPQPTIV